MDASSIGIRRALTQDLEALVRLLGEIHVGESEIDPPGEAKAASVFDAVLAQPGRTLLVAEEAGRVVGSADVLVVPNLTHGAAPWAIVENVVVAEESRRKGIGRSLMQEAIALARATGCYKVQLLSNRKRNEAHLFYLGLGFADSAEGFRLYL